MNFIQKINRFTNLFH